MLFRFARPALFALDPERAHALTLMALKAMPHRRPADPGPLAITVGGLTFPNPVGLAAGFDKDGEAPAALLGLGFGSVEIGSLTPQPQAGNARPRLFRLVSDEAVINRMGFNNGGAAAAAERLAAVRPDGSVGSGGRAKPDGILGINIGANKDSADRIFDYATMARVMVPWADYLAVNVSSPNTPGLRALQDEGALRELLAAVMDARAEKCGPGGPPVFLKVAPDLEPGDIDAIARIAIEAGIAALIVSNTTVSRPPLQSTLAGEAGGLSGAPLRPLALQRLRDFRRATGGQLPLVGVGGIGSAQDAWERIRAGASLVQLYSALVYHGPGLVIRILRGLEQRMRTAGFGSIAEAVGTE